MFSRRTFSSGLVGCPMIKQEPFPCAMTLRMRTLRIEPAGGSPGFGGRPWLSLRRWMVK